MLTNVFILSDGQFAFLTEEGLTVGTPDEVADAMLKFGIPAQEIVLLFRRLVHGAKGVTTESGSTQCR